jgi:hypothetical protein
MWQKYMSCKILSIKKKNISSDFDTIHHDVHMFVNCIYTRYIHARIHQGLSQNFMEKHQNLNDQTISKF